MAWGIGLARIVVACVAFVAAATATARADCSTNVRYSAGIVFATDREPLADDRLFSGKRARDDDADDDLTTGTLTSARPAGTRGCTSTLAFFQALEHRFVRGRGRRILVYVPGADESFVTAARQALALRRDVRFAGPIVLYSWPATVTAKRDDRFEARNAARSQPHFEALVREIDAHFHDLRIAFVTRGMGARFALAGLHIAGERRCRACTTRAALIEPDATSAMLDRELAARHVCNVRRSAHRSPATISIFAWRRRPSACSAVRTVRIAARDVRDARFSPGLARAVRLALATTPAAHRTRRTRARAR